MVRLFVCGKRESQVNAIMHFAANKPRENIVRHFATWPVFSPDTCSLCVCLSFVQVCKGGVNHQNSPVSGVPVPDNKPQ